MGIALFVISLLTIFGAIVYFLISLFTKSGFKTPSYVLAAGVLLFFISLIPLSQEEQSEPAIETANESSEVNEENTETNQEKQQTEAQEDKEAKEEAARQKAEKEKKKEEEKAAAEKKAAEQKEAEQQKKEKEEQERKQKEQQAKEEAEKKRKEEEKAKKEAEQKAKQQAEKKAEEKAEKQAEKKESQTNATVTRVVDGDTIEVSMNGSSEDVRLLLIDTPETVHPSEPVQPYGPEASQFVKDTLTGQSVFVKVGKEERDKYGRLLAYVYINGETIQEKLLRKGLARTAYLYNDLSMLDEFHTVQQTAINAGIGVWSIPGYAHVDHNHGYHYQEETEPEPEPEKGAEQPAEPGLQYDPNGADRDCGDFSSQEAAQAFMEASGSGDPHRLDGNDNDGLACESL